MRRMLLSRPSSRDLIQAGKVVLSEFDPGKFVFLNPKGCWEENPETVAGRISNELLFEVWKRKEEERLPLLLKILDPLSGEKTWPLTKKIRWAVLPGEKRFPQILKEEKMDGEIFRFYSQGERPEKLYSLFILIEVLAWLLHCQALRLACQSESCEWDRAARAFREECRRELEALTGLVRSLPDGKEAVELLPHLTGELLAASPEILHPLLQRIVEEQRLMSDARALLEKGKESDRREECCSLLIEKIQPPMGVVTLASASLLYPCMRLLLDETIDAASGIPYQASVILSILQDPRSTETLLRAMDVFPLHWTKIRENIIYTLGNLREKRAAEPIARVLEEPDEIRTPQKGTCLIRKQKEEALWALGKIGFESLRHLPLLVKHVDHSSDRLKTYLAWTLGEIGKGQKEKLGGVSAEIIIALLKLLKSASRQVFEEAAGGLRKIDIPEFTHSLYLYRVGAVSILGLKPAQKGLYELSETLHHLFHTQKRAIIAVNGDSGTGKTYFCQSLMNGFGEVKPEEILYLMRDRRKDQKVFNRILGLKWLRKYIEPAYFEDDFESEEDDPGAFLSRFLEENADKKLIILDGCRDRHYFQRVIDSFYFKGALDVEVNFRAAFSTRRMNLEEREKALESVDTHLSFLEEPSLEDTHFYQEGRLILFDLDNSISSRLNSQETRELFEKKRVESWGELVRIGKFSREPKPIKQEEEKITAAEKTFSIQQADWPVFKTRSFAADERKFQPELNSELSGSPNLLQTIPADDLRARRIEFYAQDQMAGSGDEGSLFVLTFLDNRIFSMCLEKSQDMALLGRDIFIIGERGELRSVSFERNEISAIPAVGSPALAVAAFPGGRVITGHEDGTIRILDFPKKECTLFNGHQGPIRSLAVDYEGRIFSAAADNTIRRWNVAKGTVRVLEQLDGKPSMLKFYPPDRILALFDEQSSPSAKGIAAVKMRVIDFENGNSLLLSLPFRNAVSQVRINHDGRLIAGLKPDGGKVAEEANSLVIVSPGKADGFYQAIGGHSQETRDCLIMGPRIISCGDDGSGNHSIRIWGTDFYVRRELGKIALRPS